MRLQKVVMDISIFLISFFLCPSSAITNSSFHGDARVLISVKAGLVVSNHMLDSWNVSNDTAHCSWTGVQCDHVGRVVALHLSNMKLSGPFPSEVTNLQALRFLNISNNFLTGSLPSNISKLRNLEVLDVFYNYLSGALPLDVSHLVKLNYLDLGENFFSGSIPGEYGKLANLEYLSLYGNSLGGRIPRELGNLGNLKILYLSCYNCYNVFYGGIPPEIGNLSKLVELDMSGCGLSGVLPSELGGLKSLVAMYLYNNSITGPIPPQLGQLASLKCMDLSINSLSGEIPLELSELKELKELFLHMNRLHGRIPYFIGDLPNLEDLNLWQNNFTGQMPQQLGGSGNLVEVDISDNKLTGPIPESLCKGGRLEVLAIENNLFFGPIPDSLGKCNSLHMVFMQQNYLNGSIPADLLYLPMLTVIKLQNNYLSGSISEEINNVSSMLLRIDISKYIDISQNEFSGPIPVEITRMSTLYYLNVSRNHLNGSIPKELENVQTWLQPPDFSYNNFSGFLQEGSMLSYLDSKYFVGNPYLCGPQLNPCLSHVNGSPVKGHIKIGLVLAPVLFFWLLVLGIGAVIIKARSVEKEGDGRCWKMTAFQKLNFESDDILECIKEENVIGKGGAGVVYRGIMPNGEHVAVKKLMGSRKDSSNDHGFSAEMEILGRIRHRHIVRLMAICSNHETNLLVYEYMTNGSLGELLHGSNGRHLHWHTRYKIALEAAKGLCYLHHDCRPLIIHRDVKSNNILLDSNFETHVADFGLAKFLYHSGALESMSSIAGSFGYIAPEYAYTLKVNEKSDVYSYGVVLLELITGKKSVGECEFEEDMNMVGWVKKLTNSAKERVWVIIDPKLNNVPVEEAMHLFLVALLCVQEHPHHRPTMRDIVHILTYFPRTEPM